LENNKATTPQPPLSILSVLHLISLEKRASLRKRNLLRRVPVAHTCNPSYSGGRDQEDCSSKLRNYLEKPYHKKLGLVEWLKVKALSSSPSTAKKKTKTKKKTNSINPAAVLIFFIDKLLQ
jgi:hypothetical protein